MLSRLRRCRAITALLAVSILFVSVQPAVNAAIVSTSDMVATEQSRIDRDYLLGSLEREEVQTALISQGVDLEKVTLALIQANRDGKEVAFQELVEAEMEGRLKEKLGM